MTRNRIQSLVDDLAELLSRTHSKQELAIFLDGLLTPAEIEGIHLRWELLKLLAGGMTQREIVTKLGICLGKISRGSRLLKYGNPEFAAMVERFRHEEEVSKQNTSPQTTNQSKH